MAKNIIDVSGIIILKSVYYPELNTSVAELND